MKSIYVLYYFWKKKGLLKELLTFNSQCICCKEFLTVHECFWSIFTKIVGFCVNANYCLAFWPAIRQSFIAGDSLPLGA